MSIYIVRTFTTYFGQVAHEIAELKRQFDANHDILDGKKLADVEDLKVGPDLSAVRKMKPVQIGPTNGQDPDLMSLQCHPTVKKHMVEYGLEMVDVYEENNLLLNPSCKFTSDYGFHTKPEQFPSGAALYAKVKLRSSGLLKKVIKAGSTSKMRERFKHYLKDDGEGVKIIVILPFDSVPFEVDVEIKHIFHRFLEAVLNDKLVPGPMKQYFHMLRNRGGLPLGGERRMVLACAETGVQKWLGLSTYPSEAGLFDEQIFHERIDFVNDCEDSMVDLLSAFPLRKCLPSSLASWPTSYHGDSRRAHQPGQC